MIPQNIIDRLNLKPHPEGGMYSEVYRSALEIDLVSNQFDIVKRNIATSIYFALSSNDFSAFHKLKLSDETWFFHKGSSIKLYIITADGALIERVLSDDLADSLSLQITISQNSWFAAEVIKPASYTLVSCVVYPGFDFSDFELAKRDNLLKQYPEYQNIIQKFTRK